MSPLLIQLMNRQEDDPPWAEFGRRLKELVAGEEQVAVARRLHYTQGRVSQMMRGEKPSPDFVERLIHAYKLNRAEWFRLAGLSDPEAVEAEGQARATRMVLQILREQGLIRPDNDPEWDSDRAFNTAVRQTRAEFQIHFTVSAEEVPAAGASPEEVEAAIRAVRTRVEEEARRVDRGGSGPPSGPGERPNGPGAGRGPGGGTTARRYGSPGSVGLGTVPPL